MAHSCRWRFPARPGGNSISGNGRRAGRVRVTAALRTGTETHSDTNGLGPGFDAALQVSATIDNNLQKFRDVLGEASGSSSGEEEAFCGFGTLNEHRRIPSSLRPPAVKPPHEKRPRGRPPRSLNSHPPSSHGKPQKSDGPPEKVKRPPELPEPREKRRGRPPRFAQRGDAVTEECLSGGQQTSRGAAHGQEVPERERERGPPKQTEARTPRGHRFLRTKVKLKSSFSGAGGKALAVPMTPHRRRGRPPSAERLREGAPTASGPQDLHMGAGLKRRTLRNLDSRTPQHFKLRATQTADGIGGSLLPATLGRVLGIRQSPRHMKAVRIVPSSRRSDAAVAKQLLQRAKKGAVVRGRPVGAGREGVIMRRRWTQLKNIRQFRMPVVSTVSMRVIKTPKRFIEDEASFGAPPPHLKMARLDAVPYALPSSSTAPFSVLPASATPVAIPAGTVAALAPPTTGPTLSIAVSQHSTRSSSPSLDDSSSESQAQSPPPQAPLPSSGSEQGRMVAFGRGRRARCSLSSRGKRKCIISPATGLLCSSSSQQASPTPSSSSPPPPPLLAPPHPLQATVSPTSAVGERHPHRPPAWVMPHPMAPFLPPPAVLSPLQDQYRSILRQPTFRWTSALPPRQCFSSAKYAKEGLIRKPVFDNFRPPPLTAQDVGLLPPYVGVGLGVGFTAPNRGTTAGSLFPPLPPHHHLHPSSRFGLPLHKLRPPLHKHRPLLRAPRFTPSEAHSRIFESVTLPGPSPVSLSRIPPASLSLRASSLIGQALRRRRRGQPKSPSHSMTTRSSQSGAQMGKVPSQPGNSAVRPLATRALTPASFSAFTPRPTSLPAEPAIPSSSLSSSSLPSVFAPGPQATGRGAGKGGREKASSSFQEIPAKEKGREVQSEKENKREAEKESEKRGTDAAAEGISGTVPCPLSVGGNASEEPPLCPSPKNSRADSTDASPTQGPGHRASAHTSPTQPTLSKDGRPADKGVEEEEEEEEGKEERANPPAQQLLAPALAQVGRQQVAGLLKKAKAQLCKMEKSRSLKTTELPTPQDCLDTPGRGPRIKHVCRRAAVALGRNRAVFPDDLPTLSALPWEERENILSSMGNDDKSSVAGSEEAELPVPPMRPVMRPRVVPDSPARSGRRSRRCGQCAGCQVPDDCGVCANCLDKPKFGGRNIKKQCCKERKCQNLQWMPAKMFLEKPGKDKKDKKKKQMFEKKDDHHPIKEEPAHSETPPLKDSEEKQRPEPSSPLTPLSPSPSPVPELKQPTASPQQLPPSQVPPQPNRTAPQKESVTKHSTSEPQKMPQQQNLSPPATEKASEVKLMKNLTPGLPLPAKNKIKEKEKQTLLSPESSTLNSRSTPSTRGAAASTAPCDGVRHIRGDFREDCDVEKVWERGGLSILTTVPVTPRTLCLLCASSGNLEVCCEPFHLFCLGETERPLQQQRDNWCCRRCRFCQACGQQDHKSKQQLLECEKCGNSYHPECLGPKHPRKPTKKNKVWICTRCVHCKSCGSTSPGKAGDAQWSHDFSLCHDCAKLFAKGNFCPLCDKCYDDDDYESKMMQCGRCARWVHARCENLTDEMYEILSNLPESVAYTCTSCTQCPPAEWRTALEKELQSSVRRVLTALLNSRTSTHLLRYTPAVMKLTEMKPESEENLPSRRSPEGQDPPVLTEVSPPNESPLDLESVKRKMESGRYRSVLEFSDDIVKIIQMAISCDGGQPENKKANSMVKAFFSRQMERVFPWFQVKESRFWQLHKVSPSSELLSDAVLPPSLDHNYAQCQEREGMAPAEQPPLTKKIIPAPRPRSIGEPDTPTTPPPAPPPHLQELGHEDSPEIVPPSGLTDSQKCVLCLKFGDDNTNDSGRLLYMGQNEWTHVNCALWSAEVFEDDDGALKNVHMAVAHGKKLRCELCNRLGATVCCCISGCSSKFHFMCARRQRCVFLEDKRVYCPRHCDLIKGEVVSGSGFGVARRIFVDFDGISLRKKFLSGLEPESVQIRIGSMTVDCLGTLTELSDFKHHLFPIGYQCSRVYWSTVDARRRCVYTCRILACGPLLGDPDISRAMTHSTPSISEMEPSPQMDSIDSPSIWPADSLSINTPKLPVPTPKSKVYMQNRDPSHTMGQSPCSRPLPFPGNLARSSHGIVTVVDPLPSSAMRYLESRQNSASSQSPHQHSTSSSSSHLPKQRVTSPTQCGTLSKEGTFSSAPSLSSIPQHPGGRDTERKRNLAVGSLSGETMPLIIGPQSKLQEGVSEKRVYSSRADDCKLGAEHAMGLTIEAPAAMSHVSLPPRTMVLTGLSGSSSSRMEKQKHRGRDMEDSAELCFTSSHPTATLPNDTSRGNPEKDTCRNNSVKNTNRSETSKDISRSNSAKDTSRSNSGKDTSRSKSAKDTSRSNSAKDTSRSNSAKHTSRSNSAKDTSRSNSAKDTSRSNSAKDTSRSTSAKDTSRSKSAKDTSRSNSANDTSRRTSGNDTSRSNSAKDTSRSTSAKDTSRSTSANDTSRRTSGNDTSRSNSAKDTSRSNSTKNTSKINSVKDISKSNSAKDTSRSNSVKDTSRSNSAKDTSKSNSTKDTSRSNSAKDTSRSNSVKDTSRSNSAKDTSSSNSAKDTSRSNSVKDTSRSNTAKDASKSNLGKESILTSAQDSEDTMKPASPQPLYHRTGVRTSHGHLPGPAPAASREPQWSLRTITGDTGWRGAEAPAPAFTHRASSSREKHSKVRARSSAGVAVQEETRSSAQVAVRGETRNSAEVAVREREKNNTVGLRCKAFETVGKEKHQNCAGERSSSSDQRNRTTVEELQLRCELERGLRVSQVCSPKVGKELSQRERKQSTQINFTPMKMDQSESKAASSLITSASCSLSPGAQGPHRRPSSLLLFSSTSTSSDSSESESEHHLPTRYCEDEDDAEEGEEDGSAVDENHEDDSDGSGSTKRRYPQRSARARSNMFFGLTPFYGVRSYGAEDVPCSHGEACGQKRTGGRSSKCSAEGQVDGADDLSSSSEESEEDEGGVRPCLSKDAYYYNFTRTIINPGAEQSLGRIPEFHGFLKKESDDEETGGRARSLSQQRISQLDGIDDGSESDASMTAASTTTTSASNKSTGKRKARESRAEQDRPEKDENTSSGRGNINSGRGNSSGGRGNGRSGSRKSQKESCLPLGSGKSQGGEPMDSQLSLSTDLLKSDSDNTNSDDCGNILPSDIMEFVLNTPSMQALNQQPESSSTQLLSLDEGFALDGNRGKDMRLFEDFPQQLPSTEPAERGVSASVPGEEPFLPLELPSDLSVLTTRSSSVTSQNHRPDQPDPTDNPVISLPTDNSIGEKGSDKQREEINASTENQRVVTGGRDLLVVEGHMTPVHIEADCITSPTSSQVVEPAKQEVTSTSGTSVLQGLQEEKYIPSPAGSPGTARVASTAVQATNLKPGPDKLIVVNQHLQPLYVLQTLPNGITQKIQITPSVSTAAVMDTSSSLFSSMTGGLALTTGIHSGVPASQSMFPPENKGLLPVSHHQIHTFTGTASTGCQPSNSSSLLIEVHPNDPHILVSEAEQQPNLAPNAAIVSCSSSMFSSAHSRKRPISRLQPRRSKKLARTRSQPTNMTLINLSPTQIAAGIPAQSALMELGTLTAAATTPHRKVPNIIKRPKPGVMYFEPTTLLSHGVSVSASQPAVLGHEPPTQLLPCTVSGVNPNQSVLNVLSVPPRGAGSILSTSTLTGPISGLLLKASQQNRGIPDHQMVLPSGTPMIPQLSSPTQTSLTSSTCVLPPHQLPPHQALSISAAQQGIQQVQHHLATQEPADKPQPDHSTSAQGPVLLSLSKVSSQNSGTTTISWTTDQQKACKTTAEAALSGKWKKKARRIRHSPDKTGGKKHKPWHSASLQEQPEVLNQGSCTSSTSGWKDTVSPDSMDTQKTKEKAVKRAMAESPALNRSITEILQENPKSTAPGLQMEERARSPRSTQRLLFEICSDDGFQIRSETIEEAWKSLTDKVQEARSHGKLKELSFQGVNGLQMLGVMHDAVVFLLEQLDGARHCRNHQFRFHKPEGVDDPPINPCGSARAELHHRRSLVDMFSFLASKHRQPPQYQHQEEERKEVQLKSARRGSSVDLPIPMRLRRLKKTSKKAVGVYRSAIHGRGLFCRKNIDAGEMVIEYSGTVIRSVLIEKRQKCYETKGIGSYMFRIDEYEVVDATMQGNAARFINHSCEPNCSSCVVNIQGHKHIIIFTLRKIYQGEEITYDYKFPIEGPGHKLLCNCGAKTCRKFLN